MQFRVAVLFLVLTVFGGSVARRHQKGDKPSKDDTDYASNTCLLVTESGKIFDFTRVANKGKAFFYDDDDQSLKVAFSVCRGLGELRKPYDADDGPHCSDPTSSVCVEHNGTVLSAGRWSNMTVYEGNGAALLGGGGEDDPDMVHNERGKHGKHGQKNAVKLVLQNGDLCGNGQPATTTVYMQCGRKKMKVEYAAFDNEQCGLTLKAKTRFLCREGPADDDEDGANNERGRHHGRHHGRKHDDDDDDEWAFPLVLACSLTFALFCVLAAVCFCCARRKPAAPSPSAANVQTAQPESELQPLLPNAAPMPQSFFPPMSTLLNQAQWYYPSFHASQYQPMYPAAQPQMQQPVPQQPHAAQADQPQGRASQ